MNVNTKKIISDFKKIPDDIRNSKLLTADNFYIFAFLIFFIYNMLNTTMTYYLAQIRWNSPKVYCIVIVILSLKMLLYDMSDIKLRKPLLVTYIVAMLSAFLLSYMDIIPVLIYIMFIIAANGVDLRKLCVAVFSVSAFIISWITIRSQFGKIPDLVYDITRHSFGFVYPTDYASHWVFAFLALFYYRKGILKLYEIIFMLISAVSLLYFCQAKTSFLMILAIVVLSMLFHKKQTKKIFDKSSDLFVVSPFAMATLTLVLTVLFGPFNYFFHIGSTFGSRLWINLKMIYKYGFSLMGRSLPDVGYGGCTEWPKDYTFIDNSYARIALHYGLVIFVIVMIYLTYIMVKSVKAKDYAMIAVMCIVLVQSISEHHLIDFSYNIFFFAGFAKLNETIIGNPDQKTQLSQ